MHRAFGALFFFSSVFASRLSRLLSSQNQSNTSRLSFFFGFCLPTLPTLPTFFLSKTYLFTKYMHFFPKNMPFFRKYMHLFPHVIYMSIYISISKNTSRNLMSIFIHKLPSKSNSSRTLFTKIPVNIHP